MKGWPKRVRINSSWWDVIYTSRRHPELSNPDDELDYFLGSCNATTRTIYIEETQCTESMRNTLVHEMFHAHIATSPYMPMKDSEEREEAYVLAATEGFFEIVRNAKAEFWREK